jgi:hypothetical protein
MKNNIYAYGRSLLTRLYYLGYGGDRAIEMSNKLYSNEGLGACPRPMILTKIFEKVKPRIFDPKSATIRQFIDWDSYETTKFRWQWIIAEAHEDVIDALNPADIFPLNVSCRCERVILCD